MRALTLITASPIVPCYSHAAASSVHTACQAAVLTAGKPAEGFFDILLRGGVVTDKGLFILSSLASK